MSDTNDRPDSTPEPTTAPTPTPEPISNYDQVPPPPGAAADAPALHPADQALMNKKTHAGRNLMVLAVLTTLVAPLAAAGGLIVAGPGLGAALMVALAASTALGLWFLAFAARRGSVASVNLAAAMFILSFVTSAILAVVRGGIVTDPLRIVRIAVFILIIYALYQSQVTLSKLKQRGLMSRAFPKGPAPAWQVVLGGVLLVIGVVGWNGLIALGSIANKQDRQQAQAESAAFRKLVENEDQAVIDAFNAMMKDLRPETYRRFDKELTDLENALDRLQARLSPESPMLAVLDRYDRAVGYFRQVANKVNAERFDPEEVDRLIDAGNRARMEAFKMHDKLYGSGSR